LKRICVALLYSRFSRFVASPMSGTEKVQLRRASREDSDSILEWRNHPDIRRHSFNANLVERTEHDIWFGSALKNPKIILLIGEDLNGNPIGVVRFDQDKDVADVSIYIVPGRCGAGLGALLLEAAVKWVKDNSEIKKIFANIMFENDRSFRVFQKVGFISYSKRLKLDIYN
jgi:RimJ/RimL family protein N-acetyltransferase